MKTALIIEAATQRKVTLTARRASLVAGLNTGRAARRRRLLLQIVGAKTAR